MTEDRIITQTTLPRDRTALPPASRGLRSELRCLPMTRRRREITGLTVPQNE
jgi:hypothetical protein